MNMQIYLARNNEQAGPYTLEQVNAMLANTQIVLSDLAWHEGMATWLPLGQLTGGKMVYNPSSSTTVQPITAPFKTSASITVLSEKLANGATLANVGRRISAALIDYLLLNMVIGIGFFSTMTVDSIEKLNTLFQKDLNALTSSVKPDNTQLLKSIFTSIPETTLITVGLLVLGLTILQMALIALRGQTIGKILLNIRIVDEANGLKTTALRSVLLRSVLVKYIGYNVVSSLLFFVDFVFLFTKNNRTLHDRLAKTLVVNAEPVQLEKTVQLEKPKS
jgi:uncharacterized RDD family membrane protein YckC